MPFYDIFGTEDNPGGLQISQKNVFVLAHYKIYREQDSISRGVTKI